MSGVDTKPPATLHDSGDLSVMVTGSGSQVSLLLVNRGHGCVYCPLIGQFLILISSYWLILSPGHTSYCLCVRLCGP